MITKIFYLPTLKSKSERELLKILKKKERNIEMHSSFQMYKKYKKKFIK